MRINKYLIPILLFLISFFIYYPSLDHDFVWDDINATQQDYKFNRFIDSLTPEPSDKKRNYYRPVIYLSYLVDSTIWNTDSYGYHLSNNIFNASMVILVYWFVYYFFSILNLSKFKYHTALLSATLFMLHPVHVESVSWVSARTDVLCSLFLMAGLIFHLKSYNRNFHLIFAIAMFYLSLISKELAIVFLPLILMLDIATGEIKNYKSYYKYALYTFLLLIYIILRSQSHVNITPVSDRNIETGLSGNFLKYFDILIVLVSTYYTYIYKLILPIELNSFIYDVIKDTYYLVGAFLFLILLAVILIYSFLKRHHVIYFSIFWILVTLGPSALLGIIKMTPTSLAERYLYLPSVGFCILAGYIFNKFVIIDRYKQTAAILLLSLISFYTISTYKRQEVWANNLSLWKDASVKSEYACFPHNNYGSALRNIGDIEGAIIQFLYVNNPDIKCRDFEKALLYNNLGTAYSDINNIEQSRKYFESAIKNNRFYYRPHLNLGISYLSTALETASNKDFEIADYYLTNAVELNPADSMSNHYLSILYKETGKDKLALKHAKKALRLGLDKPLEKDSLRIVNELQNKKP